MANANIEYLMPGDDRDIYSGLVRLHVLHHAIQAPVFGAALVEELARHGYRITPGTLYPLLIGLEKRGYLRSSDAPSGKSRRKVYRTTPAGRKALLLATNKVRGLFRELMDGR
jgi:DNA-binding PadR family transcriptional regulator